MKIFYARKEISHENSIGVYAWEVEEKQKIYVVVEPHAWVHQVKKEEVGRANVSDAFGLTAEEAVDALLRGNKEEMEALEKRANRYRVFLDSAVVKHRVIGDEEFLDSAVINAVYR